MANKTLAETALAAAAALTDAPPARGVSVDVGHIQVMGVHAADAAAWARYLGAASVTAWHARGAISVFLDGDRAGLSWNAVVCVGQLPGVDVPAEGQHPYPVSVLDGLVAVTA
jgi:hypothetical protein